jgi:PAS domain S-box-containing protein
VISFSDITPYKETEQALRKTSPSDSQNLLMPESNYDLWDWDLTTNEMYFSIQWEKMLGFEEHELLRHVDSWHQRIYPADYNRVMADIQNHLDGLTQVCENTHRLQHKNGNYRWILSRAVMVRDSSGKPHRMVGTHVDITEPRRMEDELNEIEKKYQQLMEVESDAVLMIDAKTLEILEFNKAAIPLYGYSRSELSKLKQVDLSAQPDKTVKLMKKGVKSSSVQYHKKKDGTVFPVEVSSSPFLYRSQPVFMVAVRDISAIQQIETALWENESKYRQLFEATSSPIVVFDANTQQVFDVNQAAVDLYGYSKPEWLEMKTEEVSSEPVRQKGAFGNQKRVIPLRWHKKKDGTVFPVEIATGNTYLFQGRSLICATVRDMTERKAHEEALRQERDFVRNLIEASPAFFMTINPDRQIRMMNKAMLQATGYSFEAIVNRDFLTTLVPKQQHSLVSAEIENLTQSMQPSLMECHILTQSGHLLLVEWHSRAVVKADGSLDYFFGVGIDVTERRKAQGHLRLFKSIIESSQEAIVVQNAEEQLIYINPAYEKLFGHTLKDEKQLDLAEHYPPHSLKLLEQEIKPALASGNSWEGELDVFYKDGSKFPIWQRLDAVRDNKGKILFIFGLMHDISERQRMWETLRKQWQEHQMIFNTVPAMIWYRDKDNRLLRRNQKANEVFQNHDEELEEYTDCQDVIQLGHPQTGIVRRLQLSHGSGNTGLGLQEENESLRWLQFDKIPYWDAQGHLIGVIVFAIDLTKYKNFQSLLPQNQKSQQDLIDFKTLFVSVFEVTRLGICLTDDRGRFLMVNQAYADLYGYSKEELMGKPFTMVLPSNAHDEAVRKYYSLLMTQEKPTWFKQQKEQHRNGRIFELHVMASPIVLQDRRRMLLSVVSQ